MDTFLFPPPPPSLLLLPPPPSLGPTFLFEDPVSASVVTQMYKLGPSYFGSFQAPILDDYVSVDWE